MTDEEKIHELCQQKKELTISLHDEQAICNKLLRENLELKTRIEKMKCCFNCRYSTNHNDGWQMYCDELDRETWTGSHCDKWELAE